MSMNRDTFWRMVADSRLALDPHDVDENQDRQSASLQAALERLAPADIIAFGDELQVLKLEAYRWDLWGVACIAGEGCCSDDLFADFRNWLVSMGRETYEGALREPDSLARFVADSSTDLFFEQFGYVPARAHEAVAGGEMPISVKANPYRKPAGTKWQESELPALFPKTWGAAAARRSAHRD